eukprot:25044-Pelagomonas_calceolata.AAC.3
MRTPTSVFCSYNCHSGHFQVSHVPLGQQPGAPPLPKAAGAQGRPGMSECFQMKAPEGLQAASLVSCLDTEMY